MGNFTWVILNCQFNPWKWNFPLKLSDPFKLICRSWFWGVWETSYLAKKLINLVCTSSIFLTKIHTKNRYKKGNFTKVILNCQFNHWKWNLTLKLSDLFKQICRSLILRCFYMINNNVHDIFMETWRKMILQFGPFAIINN